MRIWLNIQFAENEPVLADLLAELGDIFESEGLQIERALRDPERGRKDFGLTAALAVGAFTLSAAGTLFDAVRFWRETNRKYTLTVSHADFTTTIDGLTRGEFVALMTKYESSEQPTSMTITS